MYPKLLIIIDGMHLKISSYEEIFISWHCVGLHHLAAHYTRQYKLVSVLFSKKCVPVQVSTELA